MNLMRDESFQFADRVKQCFSSDSEKHTMLNNSLKVRLSEDEVKLARVVQKFVSF